MKDEILLVLFVHFLNIINKTSSYHINNCSYIDNNTDSVEISCDYGSSRFSILNNGLIAKSACFNDLFKSDKSKEHRLNVTYLKSTSLSCAVLDQNLNELFENIRKFDYSFTGTSILPLNFQFKNLEKLNSSHNEILLISMWNFRNKPNLSEIDLSYNVLMDVTGSSFMQNKKLTTINLSHNLLANIGANIFYKLENLKNVDLSFNKIIRIDPFAFGTNTNLETLHLEQNLLKSFDCHVFLPLKKLLSTSFSINVINELKFDCPGALLHIDSRSKTNTVVYSSGMGIELYCDQNDFEQLRIFYAAGNQLRNISNILDLLPSSLEALDLSSMNLETLDISVFEKFNNLHQLKLSNSKLKGLTKGMFSKHNELRTLDISKNNFAEVNFESIFEDSKNLQTLNIASCQIHDITDILQSLTPTLEDINLSFNFIGKLNATTFQQFTNLNYLNLSHTQLTNFGFSTFYHLNKLKSLDISYNNLKRVDFTLFGKNFADLHTLFLDGNNLIEINTITLATCPNLTTISMSKNQFSCHYLVSFLNVENHLHIIHNPTENKTHMKGIDCNIEQDGNTITTTNANDALIHPKYTVVIKQNESHVTKYSLLFLCFMCCVYLVVKSKIIPRIKDQITQNQSRNSTFALIHSENC